MTERVTGLGLRTHYGHQTQHHSHLTNSPTGLMNQTMIVKLLACVVIGQDAVMRTIVLRLFVIKETRGCPALVPLEFLGVLTTPNILYDSKHA